jgi:hypothetical protein
MIPRSGGRAFVTGARTRHFLASLRDAAEARGVWIDECGLQHGPTSHYLACSSSSDVEELAAEVGASYTYQVAEQIAGLLPPLDSYSRLTDERELPRGLELEMFDTDTLTWLETEQRQRPGLYRCRTYEGHLHGLLDPLSHWHRVIKEVGVYEVLRWEAKPVLVYNDADEELQVPADAALPALHARAATLCSGRLPRYSRPPNARTSAPARSRSSRSTLHRLPSRGAGKGRLAYAASDRLGTLKYPNVPRAIAEKVAASLAQELEGGAA